MTKFTFVVILMLLSVYPTCLAASIVTEGKVFTYVAGEEAELPCQVQNENKDDTVVWSRQGNGNEILFIDEEAQEDFQGKKEVRKDGSNNILVLRNLAPFDSANYSCVLGDEAQTKIVHKLIVIVPPQVSLSVNSFVTRQGENVTVRCIGTGEPRPKIDWKRANHQKLPRGAYVLKDGTLFLPLINVSSSGTYECIGWNKYGKNASASLDITVNAREEEPTGVTKKQAIPTVETNRTYISVMEGDDVELTCRYEGNPSPEVFWLLNSFALNKNEHQATESAKFENGFSYTTLTIHNITAKSYGDYVCRVSNIMGTVKTQIHVNAAPGAPSVSAHEGEIQWDVESKLPLKDYQILYRPINEDKFSLTKTVKVNEKEDRRGDVWHKVVKLEEFIKEDAEYEIKVQARNDFGWGSLSGDPIRVKFTPSEEKVPQKTNAKANSAMTVVASLPILILSGYILSGF